MYACIGWYDWVVLEDEWKAKVALPPAEMDQIMDGVAKDLTNKLKQRVENVGRGLQQLH